MALLTLLSDLGQRDYFLPRLRGALYCHVPERQQVDLSHEVEPWDLYHTALLLSQSYNAFPDGTIHLALVEESGTRSEQYALMSYDGHHFIAPNNGVLSMAFPSLCDDLYWPDIPIGADYYEEIALIIRQTHVHGGFSEWAVRVEPEHIVQRILLEPVIGPNYIRGSVRHIDHYGNLYLNIHRDVFIEVGQQRPFALHYKVGDAIHKISRWYDEVRVGDPLARFNEVGLLELAVHQGRAVDEMGLQIEDTVVIEFR